MNYRHVYHAGNFADVLKHAVLCWIVRYLQKKPAPLAFIDTHAGAGAYDLAAGAAQKTGEARDGILRLLGDNMAAEAALDPYLEQVRAANEGFPIRRYPGSPRLMAALARPADRVTVCERHPDDGAELQRSMAEFGNVRVVIGDGYRALQGLVPPPERRGLVLIDPPFEEADEFERLAQAFVAAHRKWPTGVYVLWHPLKDRAEVARFHAEIVNAGIRKVATASLGIDRSEGLSAAGLVLCNAPHTFAEDWAQALEQVARTLAQGPNPTATIAPLAGD